MEYYNKDTGKYTEVDPTEYPKIDTLFKRDSHGLIIPELYTNDIFKIFPYWECTEKIDGTNVRIKLLYRDYYIGSILSHALECKFLGRRQQSILPIPLENKLEQRFLNVDWFDIFPSISFYDEVILYGEGYGNKIKDIGSKYKSDGVDFTLFDVSYNGIWLTRESCEHIAEKLGIKIVPLIGNLTLEEAINRTKEGFDSAISESPLKAEGMVLKAPYGMLDRRKKRIITKLKTSDFIKLHRYFNSTPDNERYEIQLKSLNNG